MRLDKIDPKFRRLTDQLFFSDRNDLDLTGYEELLDKEDEHYRYLWDRLIRSMEIFWEESFWINRFEFILSLASKKNRDEIETHVTTKFSRLITYGYGDPQRDNEYIQFIAWGKAKAAKKENLTALREFLLQLSYTTRSTRLADIIKNFVPFLFQDMDEYVGLLSKRVGQSARSFEVLQQLEKQGLVIDKSTIFKQAGDLLIKRVPNRKNRRSLFAMMEDPSVMAHLKSEYKPEYRDKLLAFIQACDYREIEEHHLRNIKNLLELDSSIADELMTIYADRLHGRRTGHKGANVKRLIRACKMYPQFSPKKVLVYLSSNSRMSDIKLMIQAFPDLKTLVPFV